MTGASGLAGASVKTRFQSAGLAALSIGLAVCAAACFLFPLVNPDLFWHLSAGRWIFEHRAVPRVDWLSWTMAGKPWVDFEWLSQLAFFGTYALGGFRGLWLLKLLLYGFSGAVLWSAQRIQKIPAFACAAGLLAWALGVCQGNDLRPENFSLLFFLALWTWLDARRLGLADSRPSRDIPACAALFALWSNLHAGFPYGLLLVAVYGAGEFLRRGSKTLLGCCFFSAAAVLLHPYGTAVYRVLWEHWKGLALLQEHIREWQAPSVLNIEGWPFWGVLLAAYAGVLRRYLRSHGVPLEHVCTLLFFSLSAAGHARTGVYCVSVGVPIAAAAFSDLPLCRARTALAVAAAAGLAFFAGRVAAPVARLFPQAMLTEYVPGGLAVFLEEERETLSGLRMMNPWAWGGYLGWKTGYKVFVDGRYIFHPLLEPMMQARRSPEALRAWVDGHGADLFLLERIPQMMPVVAVLKDGRRATVWRPFYIFYMPQERWGLVYWDDQSLAFVRRAAVSAQWLRAHEFTAFLPEDLTVAARKLQDGDIGRKQVAAEIERFSRWAGPARGAAARAWLDHYAVK